MKTPEDIAGSESLQSCRRCDCQGHCQRLVGKIREGQKTILQQVRPICEHIRHLERELADAHWDGNEEDIKRLRLEISAVGEAIAKSVEWWIPF